VNRSILSVRRWWGHERHHAGAWCFSKCAVQHELLVLVATDACIQGRSFILSYCKAQQVWVPPACRPDTAKTSGQAALTSSPRTLKPLHGKPTPPSEWQADEDSQPLQQRCVSAKRAIVLDTQTADILIGSQPGMPTPCTRVYGQLGRSASPQDPPGIPTWLQESLSGSGDEDDSLKGRLEVVRRSRTPPVLPFHGAPASRACSGGGSADQDSGVRRHLSPPFVGWGATGRRRSRVQPHATTPSSGAATCADPSTRPEPGSEPSVLPALLQLRPIPVATLASQQGSQDVIAVPSQAAVAGGAKMFESGAAPREAPPFPLPRRASRRSASAPGPSSSTGVDAQLVKTPAPASPAPPCISCRAGSTPGSEPPSAAAGGDVAVDARKRTRTPAPSMPAAAAASARNNAVDTVAARYLSTRPHAERTRKGDRACCSAIMGEVASEAGERGLAEAPIESTLGVRSNRGTSASAGLLIPTFLPVTWPFLQSVPRLTLLASPVAARQHGPGTAHGVHRCLEPSDKQHTLLCSMLWARMLIRCAPCILHAPMRMLVHVSAAMQGRHG
jgi:hypothetical protein